MCWYVFSKNLIIQQVGEPAAVVFNSSIYLYVTAGGLANDLGSKTVIGLSISADGVNFSPLTQVAAQDETIYPRTSNYTGTKR